MRARTRVLLLLALAAAIVSTPRVSRASYAIRRFVLANGATPTAGIAGSGRRMYGTVGQAAVGMSSGSGRELCHGFWCVAGSALVSVEPPPDGIDPSLPRSLGFGRPSPNPAHDAARFAVDLPHEARIDLRVLDVQGRQVRVVESDSRPAGFHAVSWDG